MVAGQFEPRNMLTYLYPSKLVPEEERESEQEYRSWGEYVSSSTNSLDQFTKTYQAKKPFRHKSKTPFNQLVDQGEAPSSITQVEAAVPTQLVARKVKSSGVRKATTDTTATLPTPLKMPVQPTTSRDVAGPHSTSTSGTKNTNRYVIPKKGIQANRLNE